MLRFTPGMFTLEWTHRATFASTSSVKSRYARVSHSRQWCYYNVDRSETYVIVRPLSTVEYTSVALGRSPVEANSVVVTICIVGVSLAGCVHSSVNKPGANGRVRYDSLSHSRLYCRDREKK